MATISNGAGQLTAINIATAAKPPTVGAAMLLTLTIAISFTVVLSGDALKETIYGREFPVLIIPVLLAGEYRPQRNGMPSVPVGASRIITAPLPVR